MLPNPLFASSANSNLCFPAEIPKPKRIRTAFSPQQLYQLESTFEKNHYVVGHERKELASNLGLTETQVKVWFQNRRTKFKRLRLDEDNDVLEITAGSPYNQDVGSASKTGSVTHSEEEVIMADEVLESSMNGLFMRTVNQSNCQTTDANSQLQAAEYEEQIHIKSNQNDHNVSRVG
ncbi:unnamed protein product [Dicrocoelium dendriticum]|nr:unnamed protein product [Dicrocoelium dendriticum]